MKADRLTDPLAAYLLRNRRWLLLGLLVVLHLMLLQGAETALGRTLFLVHVGLFFLWQPFVQAEKRLSATQMVLVPMVVFGAAWWLSQWLVIIWCMTLAGVVGGKVFLTQSRWVRIFYLAAFGYLLLVLLGWLVPHVLVGDGGLGDSLVFLMRYFVPIVFIAMALLPARAETEGAIEIIDFIYSVFLFLLVAVLVSGAVALTVVLDRAYIEALLYTLAGIAAVLLTLGWTWNPRAGFVGLGVLLSRYQLSVGFPFEEWLHNLAAKSQQIDDPMRFLDEAFAATRELPGIMGGQWRVGAETGGYGDPAGACSDFHHPELTVTLYSRDVISPALRWHFDLLVQVLGEFFLAKRRGHKLQQMSYVQAVHETGARLTHDVKNLLQSLNALCAAAEAEAEAPSPEFHAVLRKQLPAIAMRLSQTLEKLQKPAEDERAKVSAANWWQELQRRFHGQDVSFRQLGDDAGAHLPASLFSSVAENLLQNAFDKRLVERALGVTVVLDPSTCTLSVTDTGTAVPEAVARSLLKGPVPSESGLGIGLYQSAQQARLNGFELTLARNEAGNVTFRLAPAR